MKKLLPLIAIVFLLIACTDGGDTERPVKDGGFADWISSYDSTLVAHDTVQIK